MRGIGLIYFGGGGKGSETYFAQISRSAELHRIDCDE